MAVGLTLDSVVLSALAAGDPRAVAVIETARDLGALVWVPAVVLAETTTVDPGRDATPSSSPPPPCTEVDDWSRSTRTCNASPSTPTSGSGAYLAGDRTARAWAVRSPNRRA